jgi:hypothetical protein
MLISYSVEVNSGSGFVDVSSYLVSEDAVQTTHEATGDRSGFAFGDDSRSEATIKIRRSYGALGRLWGVRITYTVDLLTRRAFTGVITTFSGDLDTWTIQCTGFAYLLDKYKPYTVMLTGRPAATMTTASSIEDPANGACVTGHINQVLWGAGGRPYEQAGSYPSALFYYSCEQSVIAIPYAWAAGDSALQELLKLCQASAGQLYQDADGIIRYKQPFSFADGTGTFLFDATAGNHNPLISTPYVDLDEQYPDSQLATKITCSYIPRHMEVYQNVVEDTTVRMVEGSGTLTVVLEPKAPVTTDPILVPTDGLNAVFITGKKAPNDGTTGYTYTVTSAAQRLTLVFTNHTTIPFYVTKITLMGRPVIAGEAGVVSVGSGSEELQISDNPNIQTENHARRLATIAQLFYSTARPVRTFKGVPYMPQRFQGEVVNVTIPEISLSSVAHVITAIHEDRTGASANYSAVPISGLPKTSDLFLWGHSYTGVSKQIGY